MCGVGGGAGAEQLRELALVAHLAVHAVAAHEQAVAPREIDEHGVDGDLIGDADGVDQPIARGAPPVRSHAALGLQRLDLRVVLRELDHGARSREVHAPVAGVGEECVIAREPHQVQGRAHTALGFVLCRDRAHAFVGALDRAPQASQHVAPRRQVRRRAVVLHDALGRLARDRVARLLDGDARRHVAGGVAAHAVGHGEQRVLRSDQRDVLVTRARATDVVRDGAIHTEVEAGDDLQHTPSVPWTRGKRSAIHGKGARMRVLGIETSSATRGTVALVERGVPVAAASHQRLNAHAEEILPLVERLLADAGWARASLDRVAVGVGPGSFTGLRVGIALAQGIALGLGIPAVGVPSLAAMARAVPASLPGARCPMVDARRDELFVAVYDVDGRELVAPRTLPRATALVDLEGVAGPARVVIGAVVAELPGAPADLLRSPGTDLPHASFAALLGGELDPAAYPAVPHYVRGADAIKPDLPPSPLL